MNEDNPKTINIELINYIDRLVNKIQCSIESNCKIWEINLAALRKEWELEHKNLILRYETSENLKLIEKEAIDKHFEDINGLQNRMDKLSSTFVTTENFDRILNDRLRSVWTIVSAISMILISAFIAHLFGKL
jgi:hypothetical protein